MNGADRSWLDHGCDLVMHHSNRVVRILRRRGGAIGRDSEIFVLKHDPEKWTPVFGKDHAQTTS
jgi:hypothetical protein